MKSLLDPIVDARNDLSLAEERRRGLTHASDAFYVGEDQKVHFRSRDGEITEQSISAAILLEILKEVELLRQELRNV